MSDSTQNTPEVHVLNAEKKETFALNGIVSDVQSALVKFYGGEGNIPDVSVRIGNEAVTDFSRALQNGETVLVLPKAVASGGFKMAAN